MASYTDEIMHDIYLDRQIRDWVLIPIMVVMLLVGVLRHYATQLLNSRPKSEIRQLRETSALLRSQQVRTSYLLTKSAFYSRKTYLSERFARGEYLKNPNVDSQAPNPMTDPKAMEGTMDMMKKNMVMFIPQTVIMSWISFFFSGFVISRLPFPLTVRFKSMMQVLLITQRGIDTQDMDVRWISSLSWYFLNLFGLVSVYTLLLGESTSADGMQDMQQMQGMGAPQPLQNPAELARMFKGEMESFDLIDYESCLTGIEERVLASYNQNIGSKKNN